MTRYLISLFLKSIAHQKKTQATLFLNVEIKNKNLMIVVQNAFQNIKRGKF